MRHLLAILLLLSLLLPFGGAYAVLQYGKYQAREEARTKILAGLDKEALQHFQFTRQEAATQLRWEHAGEFKYQGEWYDVVEQKIHGDTLLFWCWPDQEETHINQQLNQLVARALGQDAQHQGNALRLATFLISLCLPETGPRLAVPSPVEIAPSFVYHPGLPNLFFPPLIPPPKA